MAHALIVHPLFVHSLDEPPVTASPPEWLNLPRECLLNIASFLSAEDLCQLSQCSKELENLANDQGIWENLVKRQFSIPQKPDPPFSWKELYKFNHEVFKLIFAGDSDNKGSHALRDAYPLRSGTNGGSIRLSVAGSS